jgi:hypothetical protein
MLGWKQWKRSREEPWTGALEITLEWAEISPHKIAGELPSLRVTGSQAAEVQKLSCLGALLVAAHWPR